MLSQEAAVDEYCRALKGGMEYFDDCCEFPDFKIQDDAWNNCDEKYPKDYYQKNFDDCPFYRCVYSPYIILIKDANRNITSSEPDSVAILNAFMSSVVNDSSLWEPVMKNVVTRCNDQFGGVFSSSECGLPKNMWDVVHCTYKQELLQCPTWDYQRLPNCSYNYEWIAKYY